MLAEQQLPFYIAARSGLTVILDGDLIAPDQAERELLVAEADGAESAYGYFVDDTGLVLTPVDDACTVTVLATSDGYGVTVEAQALIKDSALFPGPARSAGSRGHRPDHLAGRPVPNLFGARR